MPEILFDSDRPIKTVKEDQFGFSFMADKVSESILSMSAKDGFVIGIEGRWGSGKSSLLNLITETIKVKAEDSSSIIHFSPWLIGQREELVENLMHDLSLAVEAVDKKIHPAKSKLTSLGKLAKNLKVYGGRTGKGISSAFKLAELVGVPWAGVASDMASNLSDMIDSVQFKQSLVDLKAQITKALSKQSHRFVVLIDDLDRLEPKEATEVIRLIRAVGDFPNVVYLLCYDKSVLASNLETALEINDGTLFLQKIIQATFTIPRPEEFDLRNWILKEFSHLHYLVTNQYLNEQDYQDLESMIGSEGQSLKTPREVALILNSLKLNYPPVHKNVRYADMCWIHIVKIINPKLYSWLEDYLTIYAVVALGDARTEHSEVQDLETRLLEILPDEKIGSRKSVWYLSTLIPGISWSSSPKSIFNKPTSKELKELELDKRIGSPSHYRFYFSMSSPKSALSDEKIEEIILLAKDSSKLNEALNELITKKRAQGGMWYQILLERLCRYDLSKIEPDQLIKLLIGVANTIDTAQLKGSDRNWFDVSQIWRSGTELLNHAQNYLKGRKRKEFIQELTKTASIGWLTAEIAGREAYKYGRYNHRHRSEINRTFSEGELDKVIAAVVDRLNQAKTRRQLLNTPRLLDILYRWRDLASPDIVKEWVVETSQRDNSFLKMLLGMRGWRASDKVYYPLLESDVSNFMNYEACMKRLKTLSKSKNKAISQTANRLIEAAEMDKE